MTVDIRECEAYASVIGDDHLEIRGNLDSLEEFRLRVRATVETGDIIITDLAAQMEERIESLRKVHELVDRLVALETTLGEKAEALGKAMLVRRENGHRDAENNGKE